MSHSSVVSMAGVPILTIEGRPLLHSVPIVSATVETLVDALGEWWSTRGLNISPVEGESMHQARGKDARLQLRMSEAESAMLKATEAYAVCRALENDGWSPDAELVRIFKSAASRQRAIWKEAVAEWVLRNGVRFDAKRGDMITFRNDRNRAAHGKVVEVIGMYGMALVDVTPTIYSDPATIEVYAERLCSVMNDASQVRDAQMVRPYVGFEKLLEAS